jgi:flagellar biosynthesis/type III secretory pathway protein FliH
MSYLVKVVPDPPPAEIYTLLNSELSSTTEELLMSWADQLKQQGLQEGLERGLEEGLQRGMARGMARGMEEGLEKGREEARSQALARSRARFLKLLTMKFQDVSEAVRSQVSAASEEDLDRWTGGIFEAESAEALIRG